MRFSSTIRASIGGVAGAILFLQGLHVLAEPGGQGSSHVPQSTSSRPAARDVVPDNAMKSKPLLGLTVPQLTPWKKLVIQRGGSLSQAFTRAHLPSSQWRAVLKLGDKTDVLEHLKPGDVLTIRKTLKGRLAELHYRVSDLDTLVINRHDGRLHLTTQRHKANTRRIVATGTVGHSLSRSLVRAGMPTTVINQFAHIFRYRRSLSRNMHAGDRFSVIYKATYSRGKRISVGPIVAASVTTNGHNLKAFRAVADGKAGYYDRAGRSFTPSFSRHPVNYTRISSPFSPNRYNPVLHIRRPHWGVDMAAATGTAIHAAARGTVKYVGRIHGYGRIVELQNFDGYSTRYAHMHRFAHGLHRGDHVKKGQVIGYVGQTGIATGPHLHFEIRQNGTPHNPLTMKLPEGRKLSKHRLARFDNRIQPLVAKLDQVPNTLLAAAYNKPHRPHDCAHSRAINAALALSPSNDSKHESLNDMLCLVQPPSNSA